MESTVGCRFATTESAIFGLFEMAKSFKSNCRRQASSRYRSWKRGWVQLWNNGPVPLGVQVMIRRRAFLGTLAGGAAALAWAGSVPVRAAAALPPSVALPEV